MSCHVSDRSFRIKPVLQEMGQVDGSLASEIAKALA